MSAKMVLRGIWLLLALGVFIAAYQVVRAPDKDAPAAAKNENTTDENKACGEGCWLPFF